MADNRYLRGYYVQAGFEERGEIEATFPDPVGPLRLQRYEKRVTACGGPAVQAGRKILNATARPCTQFLRGRFIQPRIHRDHGRASVML